MKARTVIRSRASGLDYAEGEDGGWFIRSITKPSVAGWLRVTMTRYDVEHLRRVGTEIDATDVKLPDKP